MKVSLKALNCFSLLAFNERNVGKINEVNVSPVISNPAVRWDVGDPASAIEPSVAPPRVPAKSKRNKI